MKIRPSYSSQLRKPVIYSAIFHVSVFIALIAMPGIYLPFMDHPMKIDVVWTELPKGTSEDIGLGVKQAEGLPKSTIEEQREKFQPEKMPEQKALKPEMKAPAETKAEKKPDKASEIDAKKMIKQDEKAKLAKPAYTPNKKIRDALAKIDKQLSGRQIVPEAGQVSAKGDGYKYGTGDKPLRVSPSDPEYLKYQAMVRAKIIREWIPTARYTGDGGTRLNARLEVMINMDGDVVSTRWSKTSGNTSFDQSAVRAVRKASPFPRPPDRLAWEAYNEGFLIEFDPRMKPE